MMSPGTILKLSRLSGLLAPAATLLALMACHGPADAQTNANQSTTEPSEGAHESGRPKAALSRDRGDRRVRSLVQLLAAPDLNNGTRVMAEGFLVLEKDHWGFDGILYLHKEDADFGLANRVDVRFGGCRTRSDAGGHLLPEDVQEYSGGYALVEGIYEARHDISNGAITCVSRVAPMRKYADAPPLQNVGKPAKPARRQDGPR